MRSPAGGEAEAFGGRDTDILKIIEEEDLQSFSFEGLKRRTGVHPETLSRALNRLEERSMVERAADGYRVTPKGREQVAVHPAGMTGQGYTLLKTMLPPNLSPEHVFSSLKGRWFGSLRWLGFSYGDGDLVMKWVTDDGKVQLDARFALAELTIEGRLIHGGTLAEAVTAAHQLLAQVSRSRGGRGYGRKLLFEVLPSYMLPN